eukprot:gene35191-17694_t
MPVFTVQPKVVVMTTTRDATAVSIQLRSFTDASAVVVVVTGGKPPAAAAASAVVFVYETMIKSLAGPQLVLGAGAHPLYAFDVSPQVREPTRTNYTQPPDRLSWDKWGAQKADFRPGDWECPQCGGHNYSRRTTCYRRDCRSSMPPTGGKGAQGGKGPSRSRSRSRPWDRRGSRSGRKGGKGGKGGKGSRSASRSRSLSHPRNTERRPDANRNPNKMYSKEQFKAQHGEKWKKQWRKAGQALRARAKEPAAKKSSLKDGTHPHKKPGAVQLPPQGAESRQDPLRHPEKRYSWAQFSSFYAPKEAARRWRLKEPKTAATIELETARAAEAEAEAETQKLRRQSEAKEKLIAKLEQKLDTLRDQIKDVQGKHENAKITFATAQTATAVAESAAAEEEKKKKQAVPVVPPAAMEVDGAAAQAVADMEHWLHEERATYESKISYAIAQSLLEVPKAVLRGRLEKQKLRIKDNAGDDHCQFRAGARQLRLAGEDVSHDQLRKDCVRFLRKNRKTLVGDTPIQSFVGSAAKFDAYLTRMEGNEWGDHLTLLAMLTMYKAKGVVFSSLDSWGDAPKEFFPLKRYLPLVDWEGEVSDGGKTDKELKFGHYHEYHWVSAEPEQAAPPPAATAPVTAAAPPPATTADPVTTAAAASAARIKELEAQLHRAEQARQQEAQARNAAEQRER